MPQVDMQVQVPRSCSSVWASICHEGKQQALVGKGSCFLIAGDVKFNNLHEMQKPLYNIEIGEQEVGRCMSAAFKSSALCQDGKP